MPTRTRSRDGTLPSRTFEAVVNGIRMGSRSRPTNGHARASHLERRSHSRSARDPHARDAVEQHSRAHNGSGTQVMCRLKVPNYKDELARLLGNDDEPYFGLFRGDEEGGSTERTRPSAEDRALFQGQNRAALNASCAGDASSEHFRITIHFNQKYTMDAWYRGAYPAEYTSRDYLSVCGYCLEYMTSDLAAERHSLKCRRRVPPGREIYRDGELSMWEVDGLHSSLYCQNLCLLAKSFLSSKSLYRDVQPFFFYVLTRNDGGGAEFIGYFSKQKMYSVFKPQQPTQCVSCIMSLPFTQSKGYGQFLIEFSYLLTLRQQATGSPETPLSQLGEAAFRKFWQRKLCYELRTYAKLGTSFSLRTLSLTTGIHINHVVFALEELGWLGSSSEMNAETPTIKLNMAQLTQIIDKWEARKPVTVKPELLVWVPLYE